MKTTECKWCNRLTGLQAQALDNECEWISSGITHRDGETINTTDALRVMDHLHNALDNSGETYDEVARPEEDESKFGLIVTKEDWAWVKEFWPQLQMGEPKPMDQGWEVTVGLEGTDMRGGALEIKNIYGKTLEPEEGLDNIQAHFTTFEMRNLVSVSQLALQGQREADDDIGAVPDVTHRELTRAFDRAQMYRHLNFALGRVPEDGYRAVFMREDEYDRLFSDMWGQDYGRAGARNRYMGVLISQLEEQHQAYKDVREYEGEPLPDYVPYVLREEEWDQIEEDVLEYWDEGEGPNVGAPRDEFLES